VAKTAIFFEKRTRNKISYFFCRTKTVETARADGERIRLIGAAEARAIEAVGR
jgi:cytochrome c-type biogenesis protein CcmE